MAASLLGIHHVTAITADAQKNIDFYTQTLGLRMVKLTVNFDDPSSYHLYFGDAVGSPGTALTFFDWPGAQRGRIGAPQVTTTAFAVPSASITFWRNRLMDLGAQIGGESERFGAKTISLLDPDGMQLELIASDDAPDDFVWYSRHVPAEHAIRRFHSVTLSEEGYERTAKLLTETMGYRATLQGENRFRYEMGGGGAGRIIDIVCTPDARHGSTGAGVVHHVAFRTADDAQQKDWRNTLAAGGFNVSPVMDRQYFHSIYFREPGGVLFEIATDQPGFTADEPADSLGSKLRLPPQYEAYRSQLEEHLPKLKLPDQGKS
jgi:catechol 2,3-dioxygenase-like lactoylglutathione lyase family enzyme